VTLGGSRPALGVIRAMVRPRIFNPSDVPVEIRHYSLLLMPAGVYLPIFAVLGIMAAVERLYMPLPEGTVPWVAGAVVIVQLIRIGVSLLWLLQERDCAGNADGETGDHGTAG